MQAKDPRQTGHPEPPRQSLASPWTLLGIAVAVLITLVLIFPGRGLMQSSTGDKGDKYGLPLPTAPAPTASSVGAPSDLEMRVRKEPQNAKLRFALAQEHTKAGRSANARAALEPLYNSSDPAVRQRARLEDLKLQMQEMYALPPQSPARERAAARLRQELGAMSQYQWDNEGVRELSDIARQLGARKVHADLQMRLVRSNERLTRGAVDEVGRTVLSDGEYLTAAEIYFLAQQRASTVEDQRYYFMQAMKAYQAGNMTRDGLLAGDIHMRGLANDDQTLQFMIRLARGANDLKRAQAYAKRLMRMGAADGALTRWLKALADFAIREAAAAEREAAPATRLPPGMRAYDATNYQLAYEVFVAAGNLEDAARVARAALTAVPDDMRWRERLARVTEWAGRTGEALDQWLYIARRTGSAEAWQAVLRIAPGVANDEALLEAMRYQTQTNRPLTDAQYQAIAAAYERVGRPKEAIDFLEKEYARTPRPAILEALAYLYERSGNVPGAIAAYQRLLQTEPATTQRVTMLATLLITNGNYREAYDLLERHRARAPAEDVEYMRMVGDLALRLRDNTAAQATYEKLVAHPRATLDDFTRLVNLMAPRQPQAAARLAEVAYQRYGSADMLITALGLYSQQRDFPSMRRLLLSLTPEKEQELAQNPGFLVLRAEYREATGSPELAEQDFRAALRIDPTNRYARIGLLFFLANRLEMQKLRAEMPAAMKLAETDAEMHAALGSAWLTLDEPERAIPHFVAKLKTAPNDYLWMLNYADALERAEQPDAAWRVRRHAWIAIRQADENKARPQLEILQSQARIATLLHPGDAGLRVIQHLLRVDTERLPPSGDPRDRILDWGTRELVVAWALSTEQYIQARAWLWTQYGRRLTQPAWAEVPLAIINKDYEAVQHALDNYIEKIPRYDRHQAARDTQQYRLAQDIAFTESERKPYDDEMHLRLTQSAFDTNSQVGGNWMSYRRGPVYGHEWGGELAMWSSPRLRLSVDVSDINQALSSTAALATVPAHDRLYTVTALWRHAIGQTSLSVYQRDALAENFGFRIIHARPLGERVTTRVGLAFNERTLETAALGAGGMRDRLFIDTSYRFSKREWVFTQLYGNRYYTQDERTHIGSAYGLIWETGHRFRTEYPDLHVRAAGSFNHYSHSGTGDAATAVLNPAGTIPGASFFLPPSFSVAGIHGGFGTYYRENYTRAIRPFVDAGVMYNDRTGSGYSALVGASGSLLGTDRFTVYASTGRGGTGVDERVREVGLKYMLYFD